MDDEMTGVFSDFLAEFQRNAGFDEPKPAAAEASKLKAIDTSVARVGVVAAADEDITLPLSSRKLERPSYQGRNMNSHSSFLAESFKMSFAADESILASSRKPDDVSKIQPPSDDWLTTTAADKSGLHISSAGFFAAGNQSLRGPGPSLDETDASRMAPHLDLTETSIVQAPLSPQLGPNPDPFSRNVQQLLLSKLSRPVHVRHGYKRLQGKVPSIRPNTVVAVADVEFMIMECKGEGGYGKVFKALKKDGGAGPNDTVANIDAVLKLQKPPREWEFYVCTELHDRLVLGDWTYTFVIDLLISYSPCSKLDHLCLFIVMSYDQLRILVQSKLGRF